METKFASLGDRMKWYEKNLTPSVFSDKMPVVTRIDGRAWHTWVKQKCDKWPFKTEPFVPDLSNSMRIAAKAVMDDFGFSLCYYQQSDEVTIVWYQPKVNLETPNQVKLPFGGKRDKINSVGSSIFSNYFNTSLQRKGYSWSGFGFDLAQFDCRTFQVPSMTEAINCLLWRIQDWERNFVQMVGRTKFSHKEMMNISCKEISSRLGSDYMDQFKEFAHGSLWLTTSHSFLHPGYFTYDGLKTWLDP